MSTFAPFNKRRVLVHCLLALQPSGHLFVLVFEICRAVCILGQVDMEAFRMFGVIIICSAKKRDGSGVMEETMELRKVEVFPDSKLNKHVFVLMKLAQCSVHCVETLCGVHGILTKIDKIEKRPHSTGQARGRLNTWES